MSTASTLCANHSGQSYNRSTQTPIVHVSATPGVAEPAGMPDGDAPCYVINYAFTDNIAEEHCACAETPYVTTPNSVAAPDTESCGQGLAFVSQPGTQSFALNDQFFAAFSPAAPSQIVLLNHSALSLLAYFTQPHSLHEAAVFEPNRPSDAVRAAHAMAYAGLLQTREFILPTPNPDRTLVAWLHVTDACNLRCSYCFVAHSRQQMDECTGRAAIAAVFRSASLHGYSSVKLKYAGGEPTLCFDLLRSLHEYASAQAEQTGIVLHEVMLTNGVALSEAMLDFIQAAGICLMISLDGLDGDHDRVRPFKNGAGSSQHVLRTIDRAIAQGVAPHISVTVRPSNAATLARTVGYILDRDLLFNLNFVREPSPVASEWEQELIVGLQAALAVIRVRLPRRRLIDGLLDRCSFVGAHDFACGAGQNYLAIAPDGKVARCHMAPSGKIDIWADDPLLALNAATDQGTPAALPAEAKTECRHCLWRSVCAGGCALHTLAVTGRVDAASPYCRVYRTVLPELVRLEGLRMMKWGTIV